MPKKEEDKTVIRSMTIPKNVVAAIEKIASDDETSVSKFVTGMIRKEAKRRKFEI